MGSSPIPLLPRLIAVQALVGSRRIGGSALDHIAQVARERFKVPSAAVSLSDGHKLVFAGRAGMDIDGSILDGSFCAMTISSGDVLVIEDAAADTRFSENCLVVGAPHVRFYAGAPIVLDTGEHVGSMCVLDVKPRTFNIGERVVLKHMALAAKSELERVCAAEGILSRPN